MPPTQSKGEIAKARKGAHATAPRRSMQALCH